MNMHITQNQPHNINKRGYLNSEPIEIAKRIKRPHAPLIKRNIEYWKCRNILNINEFVIQIPELNTDVAKK